MKRLRFIFWMLFLSLSSQACRGQPTGSSFPEIGVVHPTAVMTETPAIIPSLLPTFSIDPERQHGKTITVAPGEIFAIAAPSGFPTWQISYAGTVIQVLTPLEEMQAPGPQGWTFRALASGQTEVRLTAQAADCDSGTPCPPPAPITFVFTIEVK